jgi:precorrin-6A/cobalt-precorrin-6A reductase
MCLSSAATVRCWPMPMPDGPEGVAGRPTILILGGTADAAELAGMLVSLFDERIDVVTSLAGRTVAPARVPGRVRVGGFGGPERLASYLHEHDVRAVIDATHPFATEISGNARLACDAAGVARLALVRPDWTPVAGDDWHMFADGLSLAQALPRLGRRAFLTVGSSGLSDFAPGHGMWFLVRLVDKPSTPLPLAECEVVTGRGPFSENAERALMMRHNIDVLVCKSSGGVATYAKLAAARDLGLPVAMIARPEPPTGDRVASAREAADWVGRLVT